MKLRTVGSRARQVADAWADVEETWRKIRVRPVSFLELLIKELKFSEEYRWAQVAHPLESFRRSIYFLWRPPESARERRRKGRRKGRHRKRSGWHEASPTTRWRRPSPPPRRP